MRTAQLGSCGSNASTADLYSSNTKLPSTAMWCRCIGDPKTPHCKNPAETWVFGTIASELWIMTAKHQAGSIHTLGSNPFDRKIRICNSFQTRNHLNREKIWSDFRISDSSSNSSRSSQHLESCNCWTWMLILWSCQSPVLATPCLQPQSKWHRPMHVCAFLCILYF